MRIYTRHDEIPQLHTRHGKVDAVYYNHVQTALIRISKQIRLSIPKLEHMDLILQKDAWIVVDKVLNDTPIVAWTRFEVDHRDALHKPIECEIRFYHYAASMIMNKTLKAMDILLTEALHHYHPDNKSDILPFNKD